MTSSCAQSANTGVTQIVAAAESVPSYQINILTGSEAKAPEDTCSPPLVSGDGTGK